MADTEANQTEQQKPTIKWNVRQLKSSYINFANANLSRDEVVLNFGMNDSWDRETDTVEINLEHRLVMSPMSAKRLAELLATLMAEHESRYGDVKV